MSEEITPEIAKDLAPKVYDDVGHPALKATGELLGLLPRAILAKLTPLRIWVLNAEIQFQETARLLVKKLENVPPEQIETPDPHIAVPALQYISYCMDNHELREMYANLLASSMNKVVKNGVHPGYVEIIKQLCPDEAKILRHIAKEEKIPTISVYYCKSSGGNIRVVKDFSNVGYLTMCENPQDICKYLSNLLRLGLIEIPDSSLFAHYPLEDEQLYVLLEQHPYIQSFINTVNVVEDIKFTSEFITNHASITNYGKGFCAICLNTTAELENLGGKAVIEKPGVATGEEVDEMLGEIYGKNNSVNYSASEI